jgi:hypothetical protein
MLVAGDHYLARSMAHLEFGAMTTEEITKAQEWCAEQWERDNPNSFIGYGTLAAYAAHVTAEKDKEIERLRAALEMMEADALAASLYCSICGSCGEEGCGCTHKCVYAFAHPGVSERLAKLEAVAEAARDLSKAFRDDICRRDHHGYCQSHFLEEDCSVDRLLKALFALEGEKADG